MTPDDAAGIMLVAGIALVVLVGLWILLPFAVFGIKGRIDDAIQLQRLILEELRTLNGRSGNGA